VISLLELRPVALFFIKVRFLIYAGVAICKIFTKAKISSLPFFNDLEKNCNNHVFANAVWLSELGVWECARSHARSNYAKAARV
jgi:hypothetical protein